MLLLSRNNDREIGEIIAQPGANERQSNKGDDNVRGDISSGSDLPLRVNDISARPIRRRYRHSP